MKSMILKPFMNRYVALAGLLVMLGACQAGEPPKVVVPAVTPQAPVSSNAVDSMQADVSKAVKKQVEQVVGEVSQQVSEQATALASSSTEMVKQSAEAMKNKAMAAKQMSDNLAAAIAESKAKPAVVPAAPEMKEAAPVAMPKPVPTPKAADVPTTVAEKIAPVAAILAPPAAASGDVAKGQKIAKKCVTCHYLDAKRKVGPGLGAIFNRVAGSVDGFKYKFVASIQPGKAWRWDESHLAAWVCNSADAVRNFTGDESARTKMANQRICDPAKQADLIAYLKTL
ncbi:MAG: c-type cytochrome [Mariprofundaceae bacterium]|nr:c-type cytochrome [Mariprofundaceae bacterium]